MNKLYYSQYTRAHRPRWVLEELGVPFELKRLDMSKGEHKSPDYLKVHPLGALPAFEDESGSLIESCAISMYLADKYPERELAPALGTRERGEYYQWCLFVPATLEEPLTTLGRHTRWLPEAERQPALVEQSRQKLVPVLQLLARRLEGRQFIVGDHFSVADVLVASMLSLAQRLDLLGDFPGLLAYTQRLLERPAARRAYVD